MTPDARLPTRPRLTLVAAVARNGVVGKDNRLPWHLPADMAHFKARTMGRPVLMGRKTWESLPAKVRPLPGRRNLVLTRSEAQAAALREQGAEPVTGLDQALSLSGLADELMVIGGAEVYALALPLADELVLTEIEHDFDGDAHFPKWPAADFVEVSRDRHVEKSPWPFAFVVYRRRRSGLQAPEAPEAPEAP